MSNAAQEEEPAAARIGQGVAAAKERLRRHMEAVVVVSLSAASAGHDGTTAGNRNIAGNHSIYGGCGAAEMRKAEKGEFFRGAQGRFGVTW
jgi:hypothetical protein